jgi:hypothetical protein
MNCDWVALADAILGPLAAMVIIVALCWMLRGENPR